MKYSLSQEQPDGQFWLGYGALWESSSYRSPFQAPSILKYFADQYPDELFVFSAEQDGNMLCATLMRRTGNELTFLSDLKTDVNHFLFHKSVGAEGQTAFFKYILGAIRTHGFSCTLNNQPTWVARTGLLEECARTSELYSMSMDHSACPVAEADTPQAFYEYVNGIKGLRYAANRLRKQADVAFEVFTDDAGLEAWVHDFCAVHVLRWGGTRTPSSLNADDRRKFFLGCLRAWSEDGLLVRFSIRAGTQRIGFAIGLRNQGSLIFHSTTYHPEHAKMSPGKAIIHFIAEWMSNNGFHILDFGDGREDYKYTVATSERPMKRIFLSARTNIGFILRSRAIRFVRSKQGLYDLYQNKVKPILKR